MFASLAGLAVCFAVLNCSGSLSHHPPRIFFYHLPSFFSPGKVGIHSSLERKINTLVIHKNANATLVPLGTSVCVVGDRSGVSLQLRTHDKCPYCFCIFNIDIARNALRAHTHFLIHLQEHAHSHNNPCSHAYMHSPQWTCHVSWRQGSDTVWCVCGGGLYRLGKGLKISPRLQEGQQ